MISKNRAAPAVLALLALAPASCSSSTDQGDGAAGPRTAISAPTARIPTSRIKMKLGPCPTHFPRVKLATLNASAPDLTSSLVPFAARSARVCSYRAQTLVAAGALARLPATALEAATNALPKAACAAAGSAGSRWFLVSFDDTKRRVHLRVTGACVTNGGFTARVVGSWTAAVVRAAGTNEPQPTAR